MASRKQRAVTDVPQDDPRWERFGLILQKWREDELGYKTRAGFARDRGINIRLVQDLENSYRPGTYTKFALTEAAEAYEIAPSPERGELPPSMLAVLHGEAGAFARAGRGPARQGPVPQAAAADPLSLPPAPWDDPVRTAADRPYAEAIWKRYLDLPRRVTDPSGAQLRLSPDDVKVWDGTGARLPLGDRVWLIADLQRRADARGRDREGHSAGA